ncbi:DUF4843 domain-containing protein [Chitinophaga caseinilytica]|uniref:DUF4843 domain-containing protein n=1 Tax=Chitinophaga caseinilytica TaxID=2267521 RepID=UPI003C2D26B4
MKQPKIICAFLLLLCGMTACKKDEIEIFNGKPALFIGVKMDSGKPVEKDIDTARNIAFGFTDLQDTRIYFIARLQGLPAGTDRKIKVKVGGTATKGADYELDENITLPAGAHYALIPCRIIRNASMADNEKSIILKIVADDQFIAADTLQATVRISDGIPTEWKNNFFASSVFGTCTKAKYQFFFDFTGFYDLGETGYGELLDISRYLNQKIGDYNLDPAKYQHKYGAPPIPFRFDPWD